jgi:hypothetical protein
MTDGWTHFGRQTIVVLFALSVRRFFFSRTVPTGSSSLQYMAERLLPQPVCLMPPTYSTLIIYLFQPPTRARLCSKGQHPLGYGGSHSVNAVTTLRTITVE